MPPRDPGSNAKAVAKLQAAVAHHQRGELDRARDLYEAAMGLDPRNAAALQLLGMLEGESGNHEKAGDLLTRAAALNPNDAQLRYNQALALQQAARLPEALASYDAALALNPGYPQALCNRGAVLQQMNRPDEALESYERALALVPDFPEALGNRSVVLKTMGRFEEALAGFERSLALKPDAGALLGHFLHTKTIVCDWRDLAVNVQKHADALRAPDNTATPFAMIALLDDPGLQRTAAVSAMRAAHRNTRGNRRARKLGPREKIRVGYYSSDFHGHATSYLMAELFEAHNAERFELYGFSFGPDIQDEMRARVSAPFHRFIDIRAMNDRDVARLSRELGIGIAVDLKGLTVNSRPGLFAAGCAPIQINYLGYPGTMGADFIDYIIADQIVIPPENHKHFTESVVSLPNSYQPNDSKRRISERVFTKAELGLPDRGFVFCSFNNTYKIVPEIFDSWMRILKAVPESVLWLLEDNALARRNLVKEAAARGVGEERLVFAPRLPLDEHLARHRAADLFLDTWPCNAHTTASDALWAGLPVLTRAGETFTGRVAASLLSALDLPELVVRTQARYEAEAIELASNAQKLSELKSKLQTNKATSPLFDGALYAKHLEAAFEAIYAQHVAGQPPQAIVIAPLQ